MYSAEGPACDWIGPCKECGREFECEMTAASTTNSGVHVHMAMAKRGTFHVADKERR